jgi:rhamnose utilization protein RhaD (predicted bifunctional aldolase and dehydrogenase)
MDLRELVAVSRWYGANPEYVVAGGGNTSLKDDASLFVKGSGTALADISDNGFVRMDRNRLGLIWEKTYPEEADRREAAVLADMLAARMPGEEHKRPSSETLLHDTLPFTWVIHTHPALINGLTCSAEGEAAAGELFGKDALWIPAVNPGYVLARTVKTAMDARRDQTGGVPAVVLLQNHGVFVGADTAGGAGDIYRRLMDTVGSKISRKPDFSHRVAQYGPSGEASGVFAELTARHNGGKKGTVCFERNAEIAALVEDAASFYPVSSAFTPDHIVYSGSDPLFIETGGSEDGKLAGSLEEAWEKHLKKTGRPPKIAAIQGMGIFGLGSSEKTARLALELFTDTIKVAVYTRAFGGPRFMPADKIDFINTWEVEQYRSNLSETS